MENRLKNFENRINEYTEEYNKLSKNSAKIHGQNEVIQVRSSNQQKLMESISFFKQKFDKNKIK